MGCELIPDGYTQSDPCLGLNVVYRPMPYGDFEDYGMSLAMASPEQRKHVLSEVLAGRIVSWDATENGEPSPINADTVNRLPPEVGKRLQSLIIGRAAAENGTTQEANAKN